MFKKKSSRLANELLQTVSLTLVIFLVLVVFVAQGFKVYGECMEPNLCTGERLMGNKLIYHFSRPQRGDIVVFKYPHDPRRIFIKRVVGLPGEVIEIRHARVYINGRALDEHRYVLNTWHDSLKALRIPKSSLFVLGDNRDQSDDSRFWGTLPLANVTAKAWFRYWPMSRAEVLH